MGKPAARQQDSTAHGGTIVGGNPTVLIGGRPAARANDFHSCPAVTGTTPHVGGTICSGSASVLIGNMPAARMGDQAVCNAPSTDVIVSGETSVLIG